MAAKRLLRAPRYSQKFQNFNIFSKMPKSKIEGTIFVASIDIFSSCNVSQQLLSSCQRFFLLIQTINVCNRLQRRRYTVKSSLLKRHNISISVTNMANISRFPPRFSALIVILALCWKDGLAQTSAPSHSPAHMPSANPTAMPTVMPTAMPTAMPTTPTIMPSPMPTKYAKFDIAQASFLQLTDIQATTLLQLLRNHI